MWLMLESLSILSSYPKVLLQMWRQFVSDLWRPFPHLSELWFFFFFFYKIAYFVPINMLFCCLLSRACLIMKCNQDKQCAITYISTIAIFITLYIWIYSRVYTANLKLNLIPLDTFFNTVIIFFNTNTTSSCNCSGKLSNFSVGGN